MRTQVALAGVTRPAPSVDGARAPTYRDQTGAAAMDELEARALRGDDGAWNALIARYDRRVWATLLALGAAPELASDLTQETWLRLVERARAGQLERLSLPGLAIVQARFLYLHRLEARRPTVSTDDTDPRVVLVDGAVDAEARLTSAEDLERVLAELRALPPRSRELLAAVYDEGLSAAEASSRFGISVQRFRQTVCELRARLRDTLGGGR